MPKVQADNQGIKIQTKLLVWILSREDSNIQYEVHQSPKWLVQPFKISSRPEISVRTDRQAQNFFIDMYYVLSILLLIVLKSNSVKPLLANAKEGDKMKVKIEIEIDNTLQFSDFRVYQRLSASEDNTVE